MRFINPQIDYAFKKIFGSTQSKPILISFLNALIYKGKPTITDLEIIDPYQPGSTIELKDSYLDVKATLNNQKIVIVEMQVLNQAGFTKRIIYNASKAYDSQLKVAGSYQALQPVIALTITDFKLFETPKVITEFAFKEVEDSFEYPREMTLVFVELTKFKKSLEQLETLTDKWLYFLKEAGELQSIPPTLADVSAINSALIIANAANLSADELDRLQKKFFYLFDQKRIVEEKDEWMARATQLANEKDQLANEKDQLANEIDQLASEKDQLASEIDQLLAQQRSLIQRQLTRKLGNLDEAIALKINQLSEAQLINLGDALLDFKSITDLINWLG